MRAFAPLLLVIGSLPAGCGLRTIDPCVGVSGMCLAVHLEDARGMTKIDQALVQVQGAGIDRSIDTSGLASAGAVSLPVTFAIVFSGVSDGAEVDVDIAGWRTSA